MERIAVVISVGLVALAAAPAAWAESDRAAARDFGRAARRLYAAAVAQRQVVETGVNRLTRDPVCDDAVRHLPQKVRVYEARAAKRLRALGVSKRTAQLFTGDTDVLYKGWDLDNEIPIGDATG